MLAIIHSYLAASGTIIIIIWENTMIEQVLYKTNKEITKLIYEEDLTEKPDVKEMLDVLQYHIFLVHTYFDKPEIGTIEVRLKLLEKLGCSD